MSSTKKTQQEATGKTVAKQRAIQQEQDLADRKAAADDDKSQEKEKKAVQAGARKQPENMPAQHLHKPGKEKDLRLTPRFMAPDYLGSRKLQDKVALITGGDSGIGRAVAVLYAREGANVAIVYLSSDVDAKETQRCVEQEGQRCLLIRGDVKSAQLCEQAVSETIEVYGRLDILVNNAAFQEHVLRIEDLTDERIEETLQTNVGGYFRMARAAVPHLEEGAAIINTGSVVGLSGSARLLDYSATKGAVHAFTKALALSLLDRGIRVNAVAPGPVWTPLNPADAPAEEVAEFGKSTDMGRAAQPEELSPAYVFLAAPVMSGYITGIVLPVTGSVGAS